MKNKWCVEILRLMTDGSFDMTEVLNVDVEEGTEEFTVQRDPKLGTYDKIRVTKNDVESLCSYIVYEDSIKILDLPSPSQVPKILLDALGERTDPAVVELWRSHFERLNPYLELTHALDAWNRRIYFHAHIQSLWKGFVQAMRLQENSIPTPVRPEIVEREKAKKMLFIVWTEDSNQRVNTFEDNPAARVEARETVQFVEARAGATLNSVVVGYEIDKAAL